MNKKLMASSLKRSERIFDDFWSILRKNLIAQNPELTENQLDETKHLYLHPKTGRPHPLFSNMIKDGLMTTSGINRQGIEVLWRSLKHRNNPKRKTPEMLYRFGIIKEFDKHNCEYEGIKVAPQVKFIAMEFSFHTHAFEKIGILNPVLKWGRDNKFKLRVSKSLEMLKGWVVWHYWLAQDFFHGI